jgi:(R,R)-butanediol dehydrogenase/meso-butanediol dehydrogenase/diacetyl reductase
MKALVYYGNKDVRVEDVREPQVTNELVKVRIDYCGICATDMEEYYYGPKYISHDQPHPISGKKTPLIVSHPCNIFTNFHDCACRFMTDD